MQLELGAVNVENKYVTFKSSIWRSPNRAIPANIKNENW